MNNNHVEFVYYTGNYPCLCIGVLALLIDCELYTFGTKYVGEEPDFDKFWESGGFVECNENDEWIVNEDEWRIDYDKIPKQFQKYAVEIAKVFNENVEHGCCGGCI